MARHLHMSLRGITRMGITTYRIGVNYLIIIVDLLIDILILCYLCFFWFFFLSGMNIQAIAIGVGMGVCGVFSFSCAFLRLGSLGCFFSLLVHLVRFVAFLGGGGCCIL